MKLTQISIFLENKKGRISEVCSLLGKNQINIRALAVAENQEFGILRMVVNDSAKALAILKGNNILANITKIVAVEVPDQPGGLAKLLELITANNLNIEYMYAFVQKFSEQALMVFRFDDPDQAIKILQANNIAVVNENNLHSL